MVEGREQGELKGVEGRGREGRGEGRAKGEEGDSKWKGKVYTNSVRWVMIAVCVCCELKRI